MVASLRRRVLAPARAKLGVANHARIRAMEQNVLRVFLLEISSLQGIL